jgi:hypothetical protein
MKQICTTHNFTELKLNNNLLFTIYSSIQMNSPFSCYFLDLRISFPGLRSRMFYVYYTIYTYLHQLFAMFSGRLQHLPEFKFKFPASTTHRLPLLKYTPRFSGSHAMSSAKWSWFYTTILEYIKWFLVEKIRFISEAETFIYPFYRLFYLDYVYITWCQRISNFV